MLVLSRVRLSISGPMKLHAVRKSSGALMMNILSTDCMCMHTVSMHMQMHVYVHVHMHVYMLMHRHRHMHMQQAYAHAGGMCKYVSKRAW